jgi:hypothetical protein
MHGAGREAVSDSNRFEQPELNGRTVSIHEWHGDKNHRQPTWRRRFPIQHVGRQVELRRPELCGTESVTELKEGLLGVPAGVTSNPTHEPHNKIVNIGRKKRIDELLFEIS